MACAATLAPAAPTPPSIDAQLAQLGFAGVPAVPSKAAQAAFDKAKKNPTEAVASLRAAVADSPAFAEARYELARALASVDPAAARAELERLVAEDLHAFGPRIEADASFATFRATPDGIAVAKRAAELAKLWEAAIARGVPMTLFDGKHGNQEILNARVLRAGVWVHAAKRFFAIAPPQPKTAAAFVDLAHAHVIVVTSDPDDCRTDFCPRISRITASVWPLTPARAALGSYTHRSPEARGATIESIAGGLRFSAGDCTYQGCSGPWFKVDATGAKRDAAQQPTPGAITMTFDWRGGSLDLPAAGFAFKDKTVTTGGHTIALDSWRHGSATFRCTGGDGNHAYVASTVSRCQCGTKSDGYVLLHAIAKLDLTTGTSTPVYAGTGIAGAVQGADGAVYVQTDRSVSRHASISALAATTGEVLPAGLVLETPLPHSLYCCGL